jgi:predicted extracellular nuclease
MKELSKKIIFATITSFLLLSCAINKEEKKEIEKRGDFRVMFYNAENFFDTKHDSLKNDYEFLPDGKKFWDNRKLYEKINNLSKVITAVGQWEQPELVGMCEIENQNVLEMLVSNSPIFKTHYKIVHKESPDHRGIDVALLYRKERFTPIKFETFEIKMPFSPSTKTRDLLYVKGLVLGKDTLHVFVNHWPSRWGGQLESEAKRVFVAQKLKSITDSIFKLNNKANILIMGDFNDEPENISIKNYLRAGLEEQTPANDTSLYNLTAILHKKTGQGTHKYQGTWGVLDQMIVSGALLNKQNKIYTSYNNSHIYIAPFLLEPDLKYTGEQVKRTYIGYSYHGGFSDHLPVYTDFFINSSNEKN